MAGKIFLNKEISIQDLSKGVTFEVNEGDIDSDSEDDTYFDDDILKGFKDGTLNIEAEKERRFSAGVDKPYKVLKEKMDPITEDGKILKEILKSGVGMIIPNKSVVMIHYDAYLENQTEPFDSTHLRKRPYKFLLNEGNVLPGLELGIKTMKKDEKARFLVSHEYAYGPMGCPPRIPPSSEILYEVEVLNFYDSKQAVEFEEMAPEDQKKAPFEQILAVYQVNYKMANDLYSSKNYSHAISIYRKIGNLLEDVSVANEEDDDKRKKYLHKIHLNLAQCYLNVQNPHKTVIYADLALKYDENNPKALVRMGEALLMMGDNERAEKILLRAKQHKPYVKSINSIIAKYQRQQKQHSDWMKMFCKRALDVENTSVPTPQISNNDFANVVEEQIIEFTNCDDEELPFPGNLTENEIEIVKNIVQKYNLAFVSKIMDDRKITKIVKRK